MSAFGQAGFGSRNRQNQLRAQGQMDPYGNQVRRAKQAPTFNVYSQQPQPAPRPSSRPATPYQQSPSMSSDGGQPQSAVGLATPPASGPLPLREQATMPSEAAAPNSQAAQYQASASTNAFAPAATSGLDWQVRAGGRMTIPQLEEARKAAVKQRVDADKMWADRNRAALDNYAAKTRQPPPAGAASLHADQLRQEDLMRQRRGEDWYRQAVAEPREKILAENAIKIQNLRNAGYMR